MQGAVPAAPTMKDFEDSPAGGGKVDGWRLAEGPKTEVPAYNPEVHPSYAAPPPPPPPAVHDHGSGQSCPHCGTGGGGGDGQGGGGNDGVEGAWASAPPPPPSYDDIGPTSGGEGGPNFLPIKVDATGGGGDGVPGVPPPSFHSPQEGTCSSACEKCCKLQVRPASGYFIHGQQLRRSVHANESGRKDCFHAHYRASAGGKELARVTGLPYLCRCWSNGGR